MRRSLIAAFSGKDDSSEDSGALQQQPFDQLESIDENSANNSSINRQDSYGNGTPFNLPEPTPTSPPTIPLHAASSSFLPSPSLGATTEPTAAAAAAESTGQQQRLAASSVSKKSQQQHQRHATSIPSLHHGAASNGGAAAAHDIRVPSSSVSVYGQSSDVNLQTRGFSSSILNPAASPDHLHAAAAAGAAADSSDDYRQKRGASRSRPRWHSHSISSAVDANGNHVETNERVLSQINDQKHALQQIVGGMNASGLKIDFHLKRMLLTGGAVFLRFTEDNNPAFVAVSLLPSASDPNVFTHLLMSPSSPYYNHQRLSITSSPNSSLIVGQSPTLAVASATASAAVSAVSSSPSSSSPPLSSPASSGTSPPLVSAPRGLLSGALAVAGASLPRGSLSGALASSASAAPNANRTLSPVKPHTQLTAQPQSHAHALATDLPFSHSLSLHVTPAAAPVFSASSSDVLSLPLSSIVNLRLGYKSKRFKKLEPSPQLEHASFTIVYQPPQHAEGGAKGKLKSKKKTKTFFHLTAVQSVNYDVWVAAFNVIQDENAAHNGKVTLQKIVPVEESPSHAALGRYAVSYLPLIQSLYRDHAAHSNAPSAAASPLNLSPPPLPNRRTSKLYNAKKEEILADQIAQHGHAQSLTAGAPTRASLATSTSFGIDSRSRADALDASHQRRHTLTAAGGAAASEAANASAVSSVNSAFSSVAHPPVNRHSISGTDMLNASNAAKAAANGIAGTPAPGQMRVDVLPFLRRGAYFLKFSKFGKPRFYFYRLSEDNHTLCRYDTELDIADRGPNKCVDIRNFDRIVNGQTTKRFKSAPVQLYAVSFSIMVLDGGEDISLIAASTSEFAYWTQGLAALIAAARKFEAVKSNADNAAVNSAPLSVSLSPHTRGRLSMSTFVNSSLQVKDLLIDVPIDGVTNNVATEWRLCSSLDKKSLKRMREIHGITVGDALQKSDEDGEDDD